MNESNFIVFTIAEITIITRRGEVVGEERKFGGNALGSRTFPIPSLKLPQVHKVMQIKLIFLFPLTFQTELCTLEPGMDVMPRTPAHGPYNHLNNLVHNFHHHTDQTKSLQELQNEVGALLEFRDLVIETFPDLKHKMASSGANSTITGLQSSSIVSR